MSRNRPVRNAIITTLVLLLAAVLLAPLALAAGAKPGSEKPAAYTLYGDANNNLGADTTVFSTTNSVRSTTFGWQFIDTHEDDTALYGRGEGTGVIGEGRMYGLYGRSAIGVGTAGFSDSVGGQGIFGEASAGTGVYGNGVTGVEGHGAWGVHGLGSIGVYGEGFGGGFGGYFSATLTTGGTGVFANGDLFAVHAFTTSANRVSYGGYFSATAGIGLVAASDGNIALQALARNNYGLYAVSETNYGIYGRSTSSTGIYGRSVSGYGMLGSSANSYGVYGRSNNGYAVVGVSDNSVGLRSVSDNYYGLYSGSTSGDGGYIYTANGATAFRAHNDNTSAGHYGIISDGDVLINGNLTCTGSCLAAMGVQTGSGARLFYPEGATASRLSDTGTASLKGGVAVIKVDPLFAQAANLGNGYQVFLTPRSANTSGLAVVNTAPGSFEVRELQGGKGSFAFDWKIEAPRRGYEHQRMAPAPQAPAPDVIRDGLDGK